MNNHHTSSFIYLLFGAAVLLLAGCSKSDDQQEFENEALRLPQGITQTNSSGEITGTTDEDDWRISPMYAGLLRVENPAHPNPVLASEFQIDLYITGIESANSMEVYALSSNGEINYTGYGIQSLSTGLHSLFLSSDLLSTSAGSTSSDIYRIIIYDGNENVITYGDVQIGPQ